ncbi:MAG: exodeoxyribonuclease VII large subunit [Xanthomonadales bacterium]|nr:exodeoxyribonuclease VII large subunit [Xanthomonadales bacterium]
MTGAPAANEILTPTRLNRLVRQLLGDALPLLWIEGELSNLARPASGHLYFTLKDAGAQVRCAMFRNRAALLRFRPADGAQVRLRARVDLYEARGEYQLIAEHMEAAGAGALQQAYEMLKAKLAAEGLFDSTRKRPLPVLPRRLAVITSPSGAAIRDVLAVLRRRFPLLQVDVLPAPVQGAEAVPALRERLRAVAAVGRHDVVLLTRGGGSIEDLWAFNDEQLARDIAACAIPVVAAIGHEVDVTLAELAADLRAATPSAAAEAISPDGALLARRLDDLAGRLQRGQGRRLLDLAQRADTARRRLGLLDPRRRLTLVRERALLARRRLRRGLENRLRWQVARLQALRARLDAQHPQRRLSRLGELLDERLDRLRLAEAARRRQAEGRLREAARTLQALSPLRTLERGWTVLLDPRDRRLLASAQAVATAGRVIARLADGEIDLDVAGPPRPIAD